MKDILSEQGFQMTGCTDNECLVEMGKLLNVQLILGGSISKVGSMYSSDLRLIDIETGKIVSTASESVTGRIETLLDIGVKKSVNKLTRNYLK